MKLIVYHSYYGCETGCCGHGIEMGDKFRFTFYHPEDKTDLLKWAQDQVREHYGEEHVKDLDWENCAVVDWPSCLW